MSREMTNSEAISNLNHIYGIVSPDIQRSLDVAFKAMKRPPTVEPTYISDMPDDKVKDLQELAIDYGEGIAVFERKRPQGEWKTIEGIDGDEYYECSNCGEPWVLTAGTPKDNNMNFCPNCGADMRGDKE